MKKFLLGAMLVVALALCLAPIAAFAQDGDVATDPVDTKTLIFTVCGSAAGVLVGWIFKASPVPNGLIPAITGVLSVILLVTLGDMAFKEAILAAMAVVGGAVTMYETPKGLKPTGGGS